MVNEKDICPTCGENDMDNLIWIGEVIVCQVCGTRYETQPDGYPFVLSIG